LPVRSLFRWILSVLRGTLCFVVGVIRRALSALFQLMRLGLGIVVGAIVAPIAVYLLMMILGVVQSLCWGPGSNDACLVSTLAHLYVLMFVSWIPGGIIGLIVVVRCELAREKAE
jgi:hypothetical protein